MHKNLKQFERGAENPTSAVTNLLKLAFLDVDLEGSRLLREVSKFDDRTFAENFIVKSGTWYTEDGWVVGKNSEMCPGMIISRDDYFGNVMVEITAKTVNPSTHDINVMINGEWNEELNQRGNAYVAGLEAFWHGNVGFEKSPEYLLTAATSLFDFDPEKEHNFKMGNIDGRVFVVVDGKLCLEVNDPHPLDASKYGKVGFEAFSSWWKFKDMKIYQVKYAKIKEYYNPEF